MNYHEILFNSTLISKTAKVQESMPHGKFVSATDGKEESAEKEIRYDVRGLAVFRGK